MTTQGGSDATDAWLTRILAYQIDRGRVAIAPRRYFDELRHLADGLTEKLFGFCIYKSTPSRQKPSRLLRMRTYYTNASCLEGTSASGIIQNLMHEIDDRIPYHAFPAQMEEELRQENGPIDEPDEMGDAPNLGNLGNVKKKKWRSWIL